MVQKKLLCLGFLLIANSISCGSERTPQSSKTQTIFNTVDFVKVQRDGINIPTKYRSMIGAIGKTSNHCTAFHLGQGIVATAGHCIQAAAQKQRTPCQTISIEWGKTGPSEKTGTSRCIEILDKQFNEELDFAFMRVDPFPSAQLELASRDSDETNREVTIFGYPDRRNLEWSRSCQFIRQSEGDENHFYHQCDTEPGNSGSPIIDVETLKVIGIHNGGDQQNNYGVYSSKLPYSRVLEKIRSEDTEWDGKAVVEFGPFENNEFRLLLALKQNEGSLVSFLLDFDIENIYDSVTISDTNGRKLTYTGNGSQKFLNIATPVTIAFKSDYAGNSKKVLIRQINFAHQ